MPETGQVNVVDYSWDMAGAKMRASAACRHSHVGPNLVVCVLTERILQIPISLLM